MVSKTKKRKSPRPKGGKTTGRKDGQWLLPAALVLALVGGIAALLWPNPHAPRKTESRISESVTETVPLPPLAAPVERQPVEEKPAGQLGEKHYEEVSVPPPPPARAKALPPVQKIAPVKNGTPRLAIVLDDMGLDHAAARRAANLPGPVTLAFLPYATDLPLQTENARAKGHELMVHMPMEPTSTTTDPGPNALRVGLDSAEIKRRLDLNLGRFSGYVGFNNHMGSRFTADSAGMRQVINEARERGLLFLDSRTTKGTLGASLAQSMGVPYAKRDVFLDNSRDPAAIRRQLAELEALAQKQGSAIAIGHPYAETLAVLEQWIPEARAAGYEIVPLSTLVQGGHKVVAAPNAAPSTGDGG